jgi:hypothetical protein
MVKDTEHFMVCGGCNKLMMSEKAQKILWNTNRIWKVCRDCSLNKNTIDK